MNSSSMDYFQNFDKLLQGKRSSSAPEAPLSSKSSPSSVFERFSAQFDKQFGKPCSNSHDSSSSGYAVADTAIIVDMLTRDSKTKQSDEQQQQAFITRSLKARDLHKESTRLYNQEQSQFCREIGVHPSSYTLHELDEDNSSGTVYYVFCYCHGHH